jgi:hypothetical protein
MVGEVGFEPPLALIPSFASVRNALHLRALMQTGK